MFDSGGFPKGDISEGRVYPFSQEMYNKLEKEYQDYVVAKQIAENQIRFDREAKKAKATERMAVCKAALKNDYSSICAYIVNPFPEQTLFVFKVPTEKVKEVFAFVRVQSARYRDDDTIEGNLTYVTENSFPSCSAIYGKTVDDVVWDCLEHVYYS